MLHFMAKGLGKTGSGWSADPPPQKNGAEVRNNICCLYRTGVKVMAMTTCLTISTVSMGGVKVNVLCYMIILILWAWPLTPYWKIVLGRLLWRNIIIIVVEVIISTSADSSLFSHCRWAAAAEAAAFRKEVKYADLPASFSFQPIAVETLGPINESAVDFLRELGRRIFSKFQKERQSTYLFQRLSVTVQRYNAVILHDSISPME